MTVGFMLKGLPAIVFQGITLLVVFISEKEFRRLFSWKHLAGGMVFIMITGSYYALYHQYQPLEQVFSRLWTESAQRTVVGQGLTLTLKHLFLFPFRMWYHYLPWTLLMVFLLIRGFWSTLWKNRFLRLNMLVAFFNLIPYWTSPDVYPKYIMMLVPMVITVLVFFYLQNKTGNGKLTTITEMVFLAGAVLLTIGYLVIPFLPPFAGFPGIMRKSAMLFMLSGFFTFLFWKVQTQRLVLFAIIVIIGRIGFSSFVWPQRAPQYLKYERDAVKVAEITAGERVYYYNVNLAQHGASYVMTREKREIIRKEYDNPQPGIFYITDDEGVHRIREKHGDVKLYFSYPNAEDKKNLNLIKIQE
jgi:4-amino-4-deoxy-L-arabinose transferase-like glycosyltransferase